MPETPAEQASRAECWHNSSLSDIEGCPRLYAGLHVLKEPAPPKLNALAGTIYHEVVEYDQKWRLSGGEPPAMEAALDRGARLLDRALGRERRSLAGFDRLLLNDYKTSGVTAKSAPRGADALHAEVKAGLTAYYTRRTVGVDGKLNGPTIREHLARYTPVSLESYQRQPFVPGSRDLAGTWDGLYRDEFGFPVLIDHKTSTGFGQTYTDGTGQRPQATVYSVLALLAGLVETLPRVEFLIVMRKPGMRATTEAARIITVEPALFDVEQLRERIKAADAVVRAGRFPRNPAYKFCGTCQFFSVCEATPDGRLRRPMRDLLGELEGRI